MTKTTLYKTKHGKTYRLNELGKEFIDNNWEHKTLDELATIIGISKVSIKNYMRRKGYVKRLTGQRYKGFKDKVVEILRPYENKLQYEEMRKLLNDKHNIKLTKDQLLLIVKDSKIESIYGKGYIRVFVDGDKNNLDLDNIILLTKAEHKALSRFVSIKSTHGELLLAAIELAKLRVAKMDVKEVYIATNQKTGQVIKADSHTKISKKLTKRNGQYKDCRSIGENGERYIREWVVTRKVTSQSV
ncbi:hypothetical protein NH288_08395 [Anaerococcus sp. NML200537]|uniref:hypothetical protein n=1 Tax=Anaerococcus sp. NML200537 TaxID=2954485 RepID=UPI002238FC68|nr:hypothetical protein [Anaerococcus sp. NML200537]MCW6702106.1 hypothetical protein [Anaerococcus sp. NML200537]